jgi:gluconokinase
MGGRESAEMSIQSVNRQFVVMGVSGCGKSSVARELASRTGGVFLDADDFHPPVNVAKMSAGTPLNDEDRWSWLEALNRELKAHAKDGRSVFLACSALRQAYRDRLCDGLPTLRFIYLKGSKELIRRRMQSRANHFMPAALLDSQFATLEEPTNAIVVEIENPVSVIVEKLLRAVTTQ